MKQKNFFWLASGIALWSLATSCPTLAQITPDGTLPTRVTSSGSTNIIEGGTRAGRNLFHSFSQFSIPTGSTACFKNAPYIRNIFSRITGGAISNIDGVIKANGTANLFLLNPNGIIFGPNAQLNIGGSFIGSTANSIKFADGNSFSTTLNPTLPLLTISVPLGLQYEGNAGSIQVQESRLRVPKGETLALVGGNIQLNNAFLQAPEGKVELTGVAGLGTLDLKFDDGSPRLSVPQGIALSNVLLNGGAIDVAAGRGGSITIYSQNVSFNNSILNTGTDQTTFPSPGGNGAGGNGNSGGGNQGTGNNPDGPGSNGTGGDPPAPDNSNGGNLPAPDNSNGGKPPAPGNNGKITPSRPDDGNDVVLTGPSSGLLANTDTDSVGNGGRIFISSSQGIVLNGATIAVDSRGTGEGGDIQIQASSLTLDNGASLSAETASNTGGNISVELQGSLMMSRGSRISTTAGTAQASGNGGNITINAQLIIAVPKENSDISANAFRGNGGNIKITTQGIFGLTYRDQQTNESDITASSKSGLAGTVNIAQLRIDPSQGLTTLPTQPVDASHQITQTCAAGSGKLGRNELIATGRGGLPPNPTGTLDVDTVWLDLRTLSTLSVSQGFESSAVRTVTSQPVNTPPQSSIVEAQGWEINDKGQVVLTATAPTVTPHSSWQTPSDCRRS